LVDLRLNYPEFADNILLATLGIYWTEFFIRVCRLFCCLKSMNPSVRKNMKTADCLRSMLYMAMLITAGRGFTHIYGDDSYSV
jgi:hypothetical protein